MKAICITLCLLFGSHIYAQNRVGIQIDEPQNKLHIHDPEVFFFGEPPFQLTWGSPNFLQITNGISGVDSTDGLRIGVDAGGSAEIVHPWQVKMQSGDAAIRVINSNETFVIIDSNVVVTGDLRMPALASNNEIKPVYIDSEGKFITSVLPKEEYVSLSACAFRAHNNSTSYYASSAYAWGTNQDSNYIRAPIALPHGAFVFAFHVEYYDNAPDDDIVIQFCSISNTGGQTTWAEIESTGTPGFSNGVIEPLYYFQVDNLSSAFFIQARPKNGDTWDANRLAVQTIHIRTAHL